VPFHVSPHPVQPPFVCRSNELELRHRGFGPVALVVPPRPPLDNDDLMTFHRIREAQLVFELYRAALATKGTDSLLDSLAFKFTEGHCIPTGGRSIVAGFWKLYTTLPFIAKTSRDFIHRVIIRQGDP
jgi:hypothetical protein